MKSLIEWLFPSTVTNQVKGYQLASSLFLILSIVSIGRSLIHFLAPDGGAGTIAGIDLSFAGSQSVVFAFGLWGLSQLIYGFLQFLVAIRYRSLVPLMYLILIAETLGRMLVGVMKPPILLHTPPGGIANYLILPLAIVMLVLTRLTPKKKT